MEESNLLRRAAAPEPQWAMPPKAASKRTPAASREGRRGCCGHLQWDSRWDLNGRAARWCGRCGRRYFRDLWPGMRAAQIERKPGAGRERQDRCERITDDAEKSPSAGRFRCPNGCLGSRGSRFDSVMCWYEGFEAIRGAPPSRWPRSLTRIRGKPRAAEVANQFAGLGLATAYRAFDHTCRLPW